MTQTTRPHNLGKSLALGLAGAFLFASGSLAEPPTLVRYQARLVDGAGVALTGNHDLTFTIYDQENGGTSLWTEVHLSVALGPGPVDLLLGEVKMPPSPLTSDVLAGAERWLEVKVDGSPLTPRQQIVSVPYALTTDRLGTMTLGEIQTDVNARIDNHATVSGAHHAKTTDASELTSGALSQVLFADNSISASKIIDGSGSGLDADTIDGLDSADILLSNITYFAPDADAVLEVSHAETGTTDLSRFQHTLMTLNLNESNLVPCKVSPRCYDFNQGSSAIEILGESSLFGGDKLTVEAWVNKDSDAFEGHVITQARGLADPWRLQFKATEVRFRVADGNSLIQKTHNLPNNGTNQWVYIVAVWHRSTSLEIFVNGQSLGTGTAGTLTADAGSGNRLTIGAVPSPPMTGLDGRIDGVRVLRRLMSAEEILARYNAFK